MATQEHVVKGHLVRRKLTRAKDGTWQCRVFDRRSGRLHKVSTRLKVRRKAEEFVLDWIDEKLREATDGTVVPKRFSEAVAEYLSTRQTRESTRTEYRSCFRQFEPSLGRLLVQEIEVGHIERYLRDSENKGRSGRTRQKHLRHLRTFFDWAKLRSYARKNPTAGLKVPRAAKRSGRALTIEEARRLAFACWTPYKRTLRNQKGVWEQEYEPPPYLRLAVVIALLTGLRRANVLRLRWTHVDLENRQIRLPAEMTKANADLVIPIHKEVHYFLQEVGPGRPDDLVLGTDLQGIGKAFKSACARARISGIRWHDLRHTFSTWVSEAAPFVVQRRLMGHASSGSLITLDYTHTSFNSLLAAVDRLPNLLYPDYVIAGERVLTNGREDETIPFLKAWNEVLQASGHPTLPIPDVPRPNESDDSFED